MENIGVYEAKAHLASLLDRVENGEELTITRHGKPVARLVPIEATDARTRIHALTEEIRTTRKGFRLTASDLPGLVARGRRF
jgi:prevent-host-death family protein